MYKNKDEAVCWMWITNPTFYYGCCNWCCLYLKV